MEDKQVLWYIMLIAAAVLTSTFSRSTQEVLRTNYANRLQAPDYLIMQAGIRYANNNVWSIEPRREKTGLTKAQISCAVVAQLISAFVFATRIILFVYFPNSAFQDSSLLL